MPLFGEILREMNMATDPATGMPGFDAVRRKYLVELSQHTGRATILYASAFLEGRSYSPDFSVNPLDINGFMSAVAGVPEKKLDLILHTPGGGAQAAESILEYLRTRFDHIRAVIPHMAMSAGTMLALGCDEIVMGAHSQLGPIDPQFTIQTPSGTRSSPAAEIVRQFQKADEEIRKDKDKLFVWSPILAGYGPGLLAQCETERELGKTIVEDWLKRYMFQGRSDADALAAEAAQWFSTYEEFGNHGRPLHRDKVRSKHIVVSDLEDDQQLQDLVLSTYHATMITLNAGVQKLIENHLGVGFFRQAVSGGPPPIQVAVDMTDGPMVAPASIPTP